MKQKNNSSNNLVTKDFLRKEFSAFENRFEKRMENKFVTKDYFKTELDIRLSNLLRGIRQEFNFAMQIATETIQDKISKANDKALTKLDSISQELEGIRQDKILGDYQVLQNNLHLIK